MITFILCPGQVSIEFHVEKDTNFIVLHSKNLTITDRMIQDKKGHNLRINRLLEYTGAHQLYIEIKDRFRKRNNYTLNLRYTSKLNQDFEGFYISSYTNTDGERRYNCYSIHSHASNRVSVLKVPCDNSFRTHLR